MRLLVFALGTYLAVGVLLVLARNRLIFPAPREPVPEPSRYGMPDGRRVSVPMDDGTLLAGWYLPPRGFTGTHAPALLWFHGNGETVAGIAPVLREFRPPGAALLALDFRGYGESGGRPTVTALERDAVTAFRWLAARPEVDPTRIVVYGRSVGSGPAAYVAASEPVAGLILESAFTSLGTMAQQAFPLYPISLLPLGFDNAARVAGMRAPILLIQGDADEVVPFRMRAQLEAAAGGPVETWTILGASHNESYDEGGDAYIRLVHGFIDRVTRIEGRPRSDTIR